MRMLKAILIIFAIPAIITLINAFQNYADDNMSLNTYESFFMGLLPFILIGLFIFGVFKVFQRRNKGGEE